MNAADYQIAANRTAADDLPPEMAEANVGLGVVGEACEVIELYDLSLSTGEGVSRSTLIKELGDVQWYIARGCLIFNLKLEDLDAEAAKLGVMYTTIPLLAAMRIAARAKDVSELIKKHLTHGYTVDEVWLTKMRTALIATNAAVLTMCYNSSGNSFTIEEVRQANIDKLQARYGGKFSTEASLDRKSVV